MNIPCRYSLLFLVIFFHLLLIPAKSIADLSQKQEGIVSISLPDQLVKGFPSILKVNLSQFKGEIPIFSLFFDSADLKIHFQSVESKKLFVLCPIPFPNISNDNGVDQGYSVSHTQAKPAYTRTMLVDLSSLGKSNCEKRTYFIDIPDGRYKIWAELPSIKTISDILEVEILSANLTESAYQKELQTKLRLSPIRYAWNSSLFNNTIIPLATNSEGIREQVFAQMQFHILLSNFLWGQGVNREELETLPVPDYLSIEKEMILIYLDLEQGKNGSSEDFSAFIKSHPDLSWRMVDFNYLTIRKEFQKP